jgi:regulator of sigma E protease
MNVVSAALFPMSVVAGWALPFLGALITIVFFHELGHFAVARWCGVKIEAFSIGFGPEIFGWVDRKGTRWKLCWLPLGGYVKFEGDANVASAGTPTEEDTDPDHFINKLKIAIANFILAIAIFSGIFATFGMPVSIPKVDSVVAGGAAEAAGVKAGDIIVAIDGAPVSSFQVMQEQVSTRAGEKLVFKIDRGGRQFDLEIVPALAEADNRLGGKVKIGRIGIVNNPSTSGFKLVPLGPLEAVAEGADRTWFIVATTVKTLGKLFTGSGDPSQVSGAVGIAGMTKQAASDGPASFLALIAMLSVSIGLINLFPIPILDGGHLVFYAVEALRGRPLGQQAQEWSFRIGLSLVLMLIAFGLWNDITRHLS